MNRRLLVSITLAAFAAIPAYADLPQWVRTDLKTTGALGATFTGDFNGDGRPDVVSYASGHSVVLSLAQANRTFAAHSVAHTASYFSDLLVADANGDGRLDLVVADIGTNSIDVRLANGDGTFAAAITNPLAFSPTEIAAGDFNGDTKTDVVVRSYSASIFVLLNGDGAGHFTEAWRSDAEANAVWVVSGDIDGDGKSDFLTRLSEPKRYGLYFGRGDATFDAVVSVPLPAVVASEVVLADLDADGDSEIITSDLVPSAVWVMRNLGSRTFGAGDTYAVGSPTQTDAVDLLVAEVSGDEHADVVVSLQNSRNLGTLRGNGNGTLRAPDYSGVPAASFQNMRPNQVAAGDFTGDGRIDLALTGNPGALALFENRAGDAAISVTVRSPTITEGQPAKYTVALFPPSGHVSSFQAYATGAVTIKDGDIAVATGTLQNNSATIEVPSLPLGTRTITAHFAGDDNYRPATSNAVAQNVVSYRTTLTLSRDDGSTEPHPFGTPLSIRGTVTSPQPGSLYGSFWLYTNGKRSEYSQSSQNPSWTIYPDSLGTYEFYATFEGNETQPPTTSDVFRVTVKKGQSVTQLTAPTNQVFLYPQGPQLQVQVRSEPYGNQSPAGNVSLYDGTTLLETKPAAGGVAVTFTPLLAPGVHYLRAKFEGGPFFEPSATEHVRYTIFPSSGFTLDAYAGRSGGKDVVGAIGIYPGAPLGATYRIYRREGSNPLVLYQFESWSGQVSEVRPQPKTVYGYRMEIYDQSKNLIAISNSDVAMLYPYTDQPLTDTTRIKAVHVQEIVEAINLLRAAASLSPMTLTGITAGQPIRLLHITQLRQAVNDARNALGIQSATFGPAPSPGSAVRARHFQELRDAMQ